MDTGEADVVILRVTDFSNQVFRVACETGDTVAISYANMLVRTHPSALQDVLLQMVRTYADNRKYLTAQLLKMYETTLPPQIFVSQDEISRMQQMIEDIKRKHPSAITSTDHILHDVYFRDWIKSLWERLHRRSQSV